MMGFPKESKGVVPLQPLLPVHGGIRLPVQVQDRRIHRLHPGDGRLVPVELEVVVGVGPVPALPVDVVAVVVLTVADEELVELAHQVDGGRAVGHGREHVGPGGQVGASAAAIGVAAQTDGVGVYVPHLDDLPDRRLDALQHVAVGASRHGSECRAA